MRLVLLSDTHMHHAALHVPPCDVLIHAGDFTGRGRRQEVEEFLRWFSLCEAHESHGEFSLPGLSTRFLNVSNCRLMPFGVRPPVVVDLEPRSTTDGTPGQALGWGATGPTRRTRHPGPRAENPSGR